MKYIERDFPIEKLNEIARKEGNAKKPIYQIHKWWARRLGSVFRMILLTSFIDWNELEKEAIKRLGIGLNSEMDALVQEKMEEIRQTEFKKTLSKMTSISDKEKEILNKLTSSIVNKILHDPLIVLKKQSESDNGTIYVEVARKLFKLDAFNSDKE